MNKQGANGIEWTHAFGPGTGYTWNPVGGCFHDCQWTMPDGSVAQCYAKSIAEGVAQAAYPQGFDSHYWHPERLAEPRHLTDPAGIFLDSMSDLMGRWVQDWQIQEVLKVIWTTPQHVFFLLTKNAPRLLKFQYPPNLWVGVSMPPSWMFGRTLTKEQQARFVKRALLVLHGVDVPVRWMSFEPLSFDVAPLLTHAPLEWAVIGAASRGQKYYQPKPEWVRGLLDILDSHQVPTFFKGNLIWEPRRQAFPEQVGRSSYSRLPPGSPRMALGGVVGKDW